MKICLLTEGSYPYVVGGVSSWVQMLMNGLPEFEFTIYAVGAEAKDRGNFKYKLPENCTGVQEVFLDDILALRSEGMVENLLDDRQRQVLLELIRGDTPVDVTGLLEIFLGHSWKNPLDIFMSSDFFDIIRQVYQERYAYLPFTDYFWTLRSMLLPLFYLLQQKLPEADLYHSVATGYCGIIGSAAAALTHKPFILTEHGIYCREREAEIIKSDWARGDFKAIWSRYFYNLARIAYQHADKVYTLFEHNARIEADLGCAPEKIHVVPNGIHMERFAGIPELADHGGTINIGAVVRVVPIKDIITLLQAFFLVHREMPDTRLYIMGNMEEDPEYAATCKRTAALLEIADAVEFTGTIQVTDYLPKMDVIVLSSISEGQPLSVLEAFAAHRPVVATDVGCCQELIYGDSTDQLGTAGAVVAPLDFEAMAGEILRLARDYSLRRNMAEVGFARTEAKYTYEQFIEAYRNIYEQEGKKVAAWQE